MPPGAAGLFAEIISPISLAFLTRFSTQDQGGWLSPTRLGRWLRSVGYSGRVEPAILHARLTAAPRGLSGSDAADNAALTHALIAVLHNLIEQIKTLSSQIDQ